MKIYKSNYRNHWISPYTILEKVCFWEKNNDVFYEDGGKYEKLSNFLVPVSKAIQWTLNLIHPQINYVKIDRWDTWSMDSTLADIILPMLKQLKATQHGAVYVDDGDVPDELKSTSAPPRENEWDTDGNHFKRWEYVLDEMIFAFECKVDNSWEDLFRSGNHDIKHEPSAWDENGKVTMYRMVEGPNNTYVCDYEGMREYEKRIQNGFVLFGKYYQGLWD